MKRIIRVGIAAYVVVLVVTFVRTTHIVFAQDPCTITPASTEAVNVRAEPTVDAAVTGTLEAGQSLTPTQYMFIMEQNEGWYAVEGGYIAASVVTASGACGGAVAEPTPMAEPTPTPDAVPPQADSGASPLLILIVGLVGGAIGFAANAMRQGAKPASRPTTRNQLETPSAPPIATPQPYEQPLEIPISKPPLQTPPPVVKPMTKTEFAPSHNDEADIAFLRSVFLELSTQLNAFSIPIPDFVRAASIKQTKRTAAELESLIFHLHTRYPDRIHIERQRSIGQTVRFL